jgi:hypothetical protein
MTREEVIAVLAVIRVAFPNTFRKATSETDINATVNLWYRMFSGFDAAEVNAALDAIISTRQPGYELTVGALKTKVMDLRSVGELSDTEAWALVARACANGIYGYAKEFKKLPEAVQQAVGRPEQLREWAMVDTDTLQTVVASNFMRSYRMAVERKKELAMLPESTKAFIAGQALRAGFDEGLRIEKGDKS